MREVLAQAEASQALREEILDEGNNLRRVRDGLLGRGVEDSVRWLLDATSS